MLQCQLKWQEGAKPLQHHEQLLLFGFVFCSAWAKSAAEEASCRIPKSWQIEATSTARSEYTVYMYIKTCYIEYMSMNVNG